MTKQKMVAYMRANMAQYGLLAIKEDLIKRQGFPPLEVEAAALEAVKPEDPLRKVKFALVAGAAVCMLAAVAVKTVNRPRRLAAPAPAGAPAGELPMPAYAKPAPPAAAAPAGPSDPASAAKALEAGAKSFQAGKLDEALASFDEAVRLDPRSAEARANRGIARLHLYRQAMKPGLRGAAVNAAAEQFQQGKADLQAAASMDRELGRKVARTLAYDGSEWVLREQEAGHKPIDISFVTTALELAGTDPRVLSESASAILRLGEAEKALGLLDRAIEADPRIVEAHLNRAAALNALGRHSEALSAVSAAEKLDPERPEIKQLRELINGAGPLER